MKFKYFLAVILSFCIITAYASQNNLLSKDKSSKKIFQQNQILFKTNNLEIKATPAKSVKQGQTVLINIDSSQELNNPKFIFIGRNIKLYKIGENKYRGILGIDALTKPGFYKILFTDQSKFLNSCSYIKVSSAKFPIQNIIISGAKAGLTPASGELAKVQRAKMANTGTSYWTEPPFDQPTVGPIVSIYGVERYHNGKPTGEYHKGVDIKAPAGQVIKSITGGRITIAEKLRLHGGTVAIDHGQGLTSIYIHMSKIYVKEGELVKPGQPIGAVGSTGFATGPHLHWGMYVNGTCVDPMKFWIKSSSKAL